MVRICSTLARDSSESSSFLKVDPRKKQITLYDPLSCGGQNSFQKRSGQVPPKMFAFDAVFPQDASQVVIKTNWQSIASETCIVIIPNIDIMLILK